MLLLRILFQVAKEGIMIDWMEFLGFTLVPWIFHLSQLFTETKLLDSWLLLFITKLSLCLIWEKEPRNNTLLLLLCLPLHSLLLSSFLFAQNPQLASINLLLFCFGYLLLLFDDQQRYNVRNHLCCIYFSSHLCLAVLAVTVVLIRAFFFRGAWRLARYVFVLWSTSLVADLAQIIINLVQN